MPEQVGGPRGSLIDRFPMPHFGNSEAEGKQKATAEVEVPTSRPPRSVRLADDLTQLARC
jgi:chemotaxis protein MotB